jgi:gp6-like head-tail connector protein
MTTLYRLVTLAEAKDQLSILDTEDDKRINRLVLDASQIVMNYLKVSPALDGWTDTDGVPLVDANGDPLRVGALGDFDSSGVFVFDLDSNGDPINEGESIIPGPVRAATLLVIARLDDDREGEKDPISLAAQSLLERYRDPTLA